MIFQECIGVQIQEDSVALGCVRGSLAGFRLAAFELYRQEPEMPLPERLEAVGNLIADFRKSHGIGKAPLFMGLPERDTVFKEIELPLTVRESLESTLRYELERYLPLSASEVWHDLQILSEDRANNRMVVLLAVVKREVAEHYFDFCRSSEGGVSGIGTRRSALANCLYYAERSEAGNRGNGKYPAFAAWKTQRESEQEAPLQSLQGIRIDNLAQAAPFGLALAGLWKVPLRINLLRPELRRRPNRLGYYAMGVLSALALLSALAWGGSYLLRERMLLRNTEKELQQLSQQMKQIDAVNRKTAVLEERLRELNRIRNPNGRTLEIIRELTQIIPETVWVNDFIYEKGRIEIYGFAEKASDLIPMIESSPLFQDVTFLSAITKDQEGKEKFRIGISLSGE